MVILLGTHFMFKEELGSRLRGIGHTVHPYDSIEDLNSRLERSNYKVELVIIDLQHDPSGGNVAVELVKSKDIAVLCIGEHKKKSEMTSAKETGADLVITNSQASKQIEYFVEQLLEE